MKKHILICPGLTGPFNEKHKNSFELIITNAKEKGWGSTLLHYPGQANADKITTGFLSPDSAIESIEKVIRESKDRITRIFAVSSGCIFAIEAMKRVGIKKRPSEIVLWGPVAHWMYWYYFQHKTPEGLGHGTIFIDPLQKFFKEVTPIEYQVQSTQLPECSLHIACGKLDPYVPPTFVNLLSTLSEQGDWRMTQRTVLENCHHNVSKDNSPGYHDYIDLVFGDFQ